MKIKNISRYNIIIIGIMASAIAYTVFYFNYFETPTGDFLGNIRPRVVEYSNGNFPGKTFKFLPVYPLLLSFLSKLNPVESNDPIYLTAILLNIILFIPYIVLTFIMYRRFLSEKVAPAALIFLSVNIYTVYTAVNSELEMLLALLILLSLFSTLSDNKLAYLAAFLTAGIKWDSVFAVPAVMFRDFFYHKRRIKSIILGIAATSGVAIWFALSIINTPGYANPYISEIAHRGANIYRYIIDCFLVTSGFIPWAASHGYFSDDLIIKISLFGFIIIPGLLIVTGTIWGIILIIKQRLKEFAPIFVFFAGFLLLHLIYQNTKSRYVLPILWLLTLFLFYGITEGFAPWIKSIFNRFSQRIQRRIMIALLVIIGAIYITSIGMILVENTPYHILFSIIFTFLAAILLLYRVRAKSALNLSVLILICGVIINLQIFYGVRTMDHYSLRRVEFKRVAFWYQDHASASDRMLITETNLPKYYTGFDDKKFLNSLFIESDNLDDLICELGEKNITYVFVDDFYIRRYKYNDRNAIDRKARLFKKIRDDGEKSGHFKLIETFETKGGIKSYLYRFIP